MADRAGWRLGGVEAGLEQPAGKEPAQVAGQNNNCIHIWAITLKQKLSGFGQVPPQCGWYMGWSDRDDDGYPLPPEPKSK